MAKSFTDQLLELKRKHQSLLEKRAYLVARENSKKRERDLLEVDLRKAGINVEDVPAEIQRLEKLIQDFFKAQTDSLSAFEAELKQLEVT